MYFVGVARHHIGESNGLGDHRLQAELNNNNNTLRQY